GNVERAEVFISILETSLETFNGWLGGQTGFIANIKNEEFNGTRWV
ncbi:20983_t:CDS:2, partial [Gigaspora margarita]